MPMSSPSLYSQTTSLLSLGECGFCFFTSEERLYATQESLGFGLSYRAFSKVVLNDTGRERESECEMTSTLSHRTPLVITFQCPFRARSVLQACLCSTTEPMVLVLTPLFQAESRILSTVCVSISPSPGKDCPGASLLL